MSASWEWKRRNYVKGGGDALVLYVVFGSFPKGLKLFATSGDSALLQRVVVQRSAAGHPSFPSFALHGYFGGVLDEQPELRAAVNTAPDAFILRGDFPDPASLRYLTAMNELAAMAMDEGGTAMLDMMSFRWYSSASWLSEVWQVDEPSVFPQVSIYTSMLGEGIWIRTRGLRSFGRPDLSIRKLEAEQVDPCLALVNRSIAFQALGGRFENEQPVGADGLPDHWAYRLEGSLDDPTFNNEHWEIS
jgi:hypothetical protein